MMPTARPVAYIRRSVVSRASPGDLSREYQTAEVRRLAGDDGASLEIVAGDWGRSARHDKTDKRLAFLDVLARIERGEVSTLYAYSGDRLARSVEWSARLLNACERAGTTIVTTEGRFAPGDDGARITFQVLAVMNENAVRAMEKKAKATAARREARGDKKGTPPYGQRIAARKAGEPVTWEPDPTEPIERVMDAYREAGSFHGAARLLNAWKVKAPRGTTWYGSRVRDVLKRERPDVAEVRRTAPRVAYGRESGLFRRLLVCHCGGIPTPNRQRSGAFSYRCPRGHSDRANHPAVQVPESVILEWVKGEAAHLRPAFDATAGEDATERRAELVTRKRRIGRALVRGLLDDAETAEAVAARAAIDAELDALDDRATIRLIPAGIDWEAEPAAIREAVSAIFDHIDLGPDMRPVSAAWNVPEWRAP